MSAVPLDRPLMAEPLGLDLLNTEWGLGEAHRDVLGTLEGVRAWLREIGQQAPSNLLPEVQAALLHARATMRRVLESPHDAEAREALNAVLGRGHVVRFLGPAGPQERAEVPEAERVAWLAADNLLTLLGSRAHQIRRCSNSNCTLYFLDTSKNHSRTWCSMKTCGNRAKFRRYAQKQRGRDTPAEE